MQNTETSESENVEVTPKPQGRPRKNPKFVRVQITNTGEMKLPGRGKPNSNITYKKIPVPYGWKRTDPIPSVAA